MVVARVFVCVHKQTVDLSRQCFTRTATRNIEVAMIGKIEEEKSIAGYKFAALRAASTSQ